VAVAVTLLLYGSSSWVNVVLGASGVLLVAALLLFSLLTSLYVTTFCQCVAVRKPKDAQADAAVSGGVWRIAYALDWSSMRWVGHRADPPGGRMFLGMYGAMFDLHSGVGRRYWFGFAELSVGVVFAVLSSVQPLTKSGCYAVSICQLLVQMGVLAVILGWRPYTGRGDAITSIASYAGNTVLCVMSVVFLEFAGASDGATDQSVLILSTTLTIFSFVNVVVVIVHRAARVALLIRNESSLSWSGVLMEALWWRQRRMPHPSFTVSIGHPTRSSAANALPIFNPQRTTAANDAERLNVLRCLIEMAARRDAHSWTS
jgi:hypothetical protein